jgi:flagellar biosynthesis protein FliO
VNFQPEFQIREEGVNVSIPIAEGPIAEGRITKEKAIRAGTPLSKLVSFLRRVASAATARRGERRLRLCEMLPLGEKRFVAVVEYGSERFILAGTPQRISLLKRLGRNRGPAEAPNDLRRFEPGPGNCVDRP